MATVIKKWGVYQNDMPPTFTIFNNYGRGTRTPTNRVRVCCATITQFRNIEPTSLLYQKYEKNQCFLKKIKKNFNVSIKERGAVAP